MNSEKEKGCGFYGLAEKTLRLTVNKSVYNEYHRFQATVVKIIFVEKCVQSVPLSSSLYNKRKRGRGLEPEIIPKL